MMRLASLMRSAFNADYIGTWAVLNSDGRCFPQTGGSLFRRFYGLSVPRSEFGQQSAIYGKRCFDGTFQFDGLGGMVDL
jgi:hypothetical protein